MDNVQNETKKITNKIISNQSTTKEQIMNNLTTKPKNKVVNNIIYGIK
jgi:hypothetical protein